VSRGRIRIVNRSDFTNLADFAGSWELSADARGVLARGDLGLLELAPHDSIDIDLPLPPVDPAPGVEYFLKVEFRTREDRPFLPAGWVAAWEQFALPSHRPPEPVRSADLPDLQLTETGERIAVSGPDFALGIDRRTGLLASYAVDGHELLAGPLEPDFWRAPTDNDYGNGMPRRQGVWKDAGRIRSLRELRVDSLSPGHLRVSAVLDLPAVEAAQHLVYDVFGSGETVVSSRFVPPTEALGEDALPEIPRIGLRVGIAGAYDHITWYGRGPHENYVDRKTSAPVGVYAASADDLYYPYIRPQENGNRTEARWVAFRDADGVGLVVYGMPTIDWSALHYLQEDLDEGPAKRGRHTYDLTRRDDITVHLDHAQMGVGGDNSWGAQPLDAYRLPAREYEWTFRIAPTGAGRPEPMQGRHLSAPGAGSENPEGAR